MNASKHIPVLLKEVIRELNPSDGGVYIDGTFGGGSYTESILKKCDSKVVGIDRDEKALEKGLELRNKYSKRLNLIHGCFGNLEQILVNNNIFKVNGIAIDLGVSSFQLDKAERGFSFSKNGPLDMRMGSTTKTAYEIVNTFDQDSLAKIIRRFGEERYANKISKEIVLYRNNKPIFTTEELSQIISNVIRNNNSNIHPATRTFQALRIAVNDELEELKKVLLAAERSLLPGGVIVVVSFHSLEDRIVKKFFANRSGKISTNKYMPIRSEYLPTFKISTRMIRPSESEIRVNPRSRSAKLRAAVRTDADPWPESAIS